MFTKIKNALYEEFVGTWKGFFKEKINPVTLILTVLSVVCLLVSNIIAVKTVPLGFTIGGISVALPAAIILFPLVLIISDLLAQLDFKWTRRSCHIGFVLNLLMVGVFAIAIGVPGIINNVFEAGANSMMGQVLGSSWFMLVASMVSFYFGDLVNDLVFKKMRERHGDSNGALFGRCVLSTLFGQIIDSTIFLSLGMNILPKAVLGFAFMEWPQVGLAIVLQVVVKVLYEVILSPVIVTLCKKVSKAD